MSRPKIYDDGRFYVTEGHERWYMYAHATAEIHNGWIAQCVEINVWKKKYKSDPAIFVEKNRQRRMGAIRRHIEKLELQIEVLEEEYRILS